MKRRLLFMIVLYGFWGIFCSTFLVAQAAKGIIQGTVFNESDQPIFKAKIMFLRWEAGPQADGVRSVESDDTGHFTMNELPWGTYRVYAAKEEEGYPIAFFSFYGEKQFLTATVSPQSPLARVSFTLGAKAGVLHVASLTDADTGKDLLPVAGITLNRADNPRSFIGMNAGTARILVPSGTDVTVEIEADGYAMWPQPNEAKLGQIRLEPEQSIELRVELKPLSGVAAEIDRMVRRAADANMRVAFHGKITGPFPPAKEDLLRLQELGKQGIEALANYLQPTRSGMEQGGAVSLLINLGGDQALDTLEEFALHAQDMTGRLSALTALSTSTRQKDLILIKDISTADPDPKIRETAVKLLEKMKADNYQ